MNLKTCFALASAIAFTTFAASAADANTNSWETTIGAGLTLTKGNSDTLLANINGISTKKWYENELMFGGDATYGETESTKTTDTLRAYGQYNRLFSERFFGYLRVEGLRDTIADVDYRFTFSPGVGYYFIKDAATFLRGEVGPGYIVEKKGGKTDDYMVIRLAERLEHKFNDRAKLWQSIEFLPQVDDWENFIINAELGIETMISNSFSLRTYLQDTYDNEPAPGRDENDLKLVAGIGYKF